MYTFYKDILKKELHDWCEQDDWSNWYAVTLTMKQTYVNDNKVRVFLNESRAGNNLKNFLDKLNYCAFKKAYKRFNKRYQVIPVLENHRETSESNNLKNYHFHLVIDNPRNLSLEEFYKLVFKLWISTDFGNVQVDVKPVNDSGWLKYSTKATNENLDNVDFENLWLANYKSEK